MILFNNTYSKLPSSFFERVSPPVFKAPRLLAYNHQLAKELGIESLDKTNDELAQIFSGQKILEGSEPLAMGYSGHQFGHFNPTLGDGRATLLGETKGFDIQLKGAGQTPYSRRGDGRSALGPVIREYIVSEAMYHLGVPTTRALAAVQTGEDVYRNYPEPGGVFTRVASSHLRVGTFQFFAEKKDIDGLRTLLAYAIKRHYPELEDSEDKALQFLVQVARAQASLVSHWMSLGFIHGVMNTDNSSVAGITIDYGPCAFMDEFNFKKVFSSIDQNGRYSYINQGPITHWNILRLADALLELIDVDQKIAITKVEEALSFLPSLILTSFEDKMSQKLGLKKKDSSLIENFLVYLQNEELDFTLAFRNLPHLFEGKSDFYPKTGELENFLVKWRDNVDVSNLDRINPLYIPRNHQVQNAIDGAYKGDLTIFNELIELLQNPFDKNDKLDHYKIPPKPDQRVCATFCGT